MTVSFTILGAPRTKKNSPQIVQAMNRAVLVPSEAYKRWFKEALKQSPVIRADLRVIHRLPIPITNEVSIKATFFRERRTGDAVGYYQALGDYLQAPRTKPRRNGAGIIADDSQIRDWDGSRLLADTANPRVEVEMTIIGEPIGEQQRL